MICALFK